MGHEERILGAAAGDYELSYFVFAQGEAVEGLGDGDGSEDRDGVDEIVRIGVVTAAQGQEFFYVGGAEIFAAGGFGRLEFEVRIAE